MLRSLSRLIRRASIPSAILRHPPLRPFCSALLVDRNLSRALKLEIEHEEQTDAKQPPPRLQSFDLVNLGVNVELRRDLGKELMTVRFTIAQEDISDENSKSKSKFSFRDMLSQKSAEEETIADRYFTVVVEKEGKALLFDCSWHQGGLDIQHVAHFDQAKEAHLVSKNGSDATTVYEGPAVADLSDHLGELWYKYLESRGVDAAMGDFMTQYAKYKEQKEYVTWLGKTLSFVQS